MIMEIVGSIWWLLITLGVLVTIHEFGHFWVARRCGVQVTRFSIGWGRPLLTRVGRDGTEYVISALPLGGYVSWLDEDKADVPAHLRHKAFNNKTVWQRIAIVAAGPIANLLLCIGLLWLMFVVGKPDFLPIAAQVDGLAAEAGFRPGDRILDVDGRATATWTDAGIALTMASLDRRATPVRVLGTDGGERLLTLPLDRPGLVIREREAVADLGLKSKWQADEPARVGAVSAGAAAEGALRPGDLILALDGQPVAFYDEITPLLQTVARAGEAVTVRVRRDGSERDVRVDPRLADVAGEQRWILGVQPDLSSRTPDMLLRQGPLAAVPAALAETWNIARSTFGVLRRMVTGQASLQNVSGPVTIAKVANVSAASGFVWFVNFLAILSLSLCIINLLPIPVLDGGHLLYYLIELVKGSPVGERVLVAGQYVGLAFIACLMGLAFYNDLFRPSF